MQMIARRVQSSQSLSTGLHILLWGFVAAAVIASFAAPLPDFDEAIPLVHGMLVQQGRIPNLDFASFYPPLGLYLNAAAFNLLGRSVLATRAIAAILYVLVLLLTYRFLWLRFPRSRPIVPVAVLLLAGSIGLTLNLAVWPGFATAFIALLTYLCYQSAGGRSQWIVGLAGLLTGIACLYRVNFGAYVAAVVVCDLLLQWWLDRDARWDRERLKATLSKLLTYAVPLTIFIAVFCL